MYTQLVRLFGCDRATPRKAAGVFVAFLLGSTLTLLSPAAHAGTADLAWDPSPSAGVAGYNVHVGTSSGSYSSTFDAGNQTTFTVPGLTEGQTYYFAVTAYNGTVPESDFSNEVSTQIPFAAPTADFSASPTSGEAPLAVTFSETSTGNVTDWSWDFGDGASSTAQNPSHTYASAGSYTVSLTVSGPGGTDTATKTDHIQVSAPAPGPVTADFTANPTSGDAPLAVTFTDASSGDIGDWSWDFGDGASSTAQNPSHTYTAAGMYTASLTVTRSDGGDTDTKNVTITVTPPAPTADFTASTTSGTAPLAVTFTDASTGDVGKWLWDFGDGTTSTAQNPTHTYSAPGTYTASLTVSRADGSDPDTKSVGITVTDDTPVADFTVSTTSGDAPLIVTFTDTSSGDVGSRLWDFGDGNTSTAAQAANTYDTPGSYTATLTVSRADGSDPDTKSVTITVTSPAPAADFTASPTSGDAPLSVAFTDASTGDVGSRLWDFDDGNTSTARNPSHTYSAAGTYTASLTVSRSDGSDPDTKDVTITVTEPAPEAAFGASPRQGTGSLTVDFQDVSKGNVTDWSWDFGDGTSGTATNPTHTYSKPGRYTVKLTVSGPTGSDTETKPDYIKVASGPVTVEAGQVQVDHNWGRVSFTESFFDPIVVVKPLGDAETESAVVRIRGVDATGFEVRIQEWEQLDGVHLPETVSYLAMERGTHVLASGARVEAERFDTDRTKFEQRAFSEGFGAEPVLLAAVTTENETDAVLVRLRGINRNNFNAELQEHDSGSHALETISYIAWEPSLGTVGKLSYEVAGTAETVDGKGHRIDYGGNYTASPMFLADLQTTKGRGSANLRWTAADARGFTVRIDGNGNPLLRIEGGSSGGSAGEYTLIRVLKEPTPSSRQSLFKVKKPAADKGASVTKIPKGGSGKGRERVGYVALLTLAPQADADNDGLVNVDETGLYGTQPHLADSDGDGLSDGDEVALWGAGWSADVDADGIVNLLDFDADGDGVSDGTEVKLGSDPGDPGSTP